MMAANRKAVSSDFHSAMRPIDTHEARDQEEARDVEPEPLREQAEQQRGDEHLHHPAELRTGDECLPGACAGHQRGHEPVQAGGGEDEAEIEREVAGLRSVRGPRDAGAPIVVAEQDRQREQHQRNDDLDGAGADDGGRVVRWSGRVLDDDFSFRCGHWLLRSSLVSWMRCNVSAAAASRGESGAALRLEYARRSVSASSSSSRQILPRSSGSCSAYRPPPGT